MAQRYEKWLKPDQEELMKDPPPGLRALREQAPKTFAELFGYEEDSEEGDDGEPPAEPAARRPLFADETSPASDGEPAESEPAVSVLSLTDMFDRPDEPSLKTMPPAEPAAAVAEEFFGVESLATDDVDAELTEEPAEPMQSAAAWPEPAYEPEAPDVPEVMVEAARDEIADAAEQEAPAVDQSGETLDPSNLVAFPERRGTMAEEWEKISAPSNREFTWLPEPEEIDPEDQARLLAAAQSRRMGSLDPATEAVKLRLHERLIDELEQGQLETLDPARRRDAVEAAARALIQQEGIRIPVDVRDEVIAGVADEVLGLGPLEPLLQDPSVTEVMVNGVDKIFFEREGRIYRSHMRFRDHGHVLRIIERIVSPLGRRIDESSPMVDARLPDGSRVNVTIPPVSPHGATVTIRKFRADKMTMEDLVKVGSLNEVAVEFLKAAVRAKLNIIVSGGTGTGKTTMLNALSAYIPHTERIITIEDPSELRLQQEHVITMEARPPSLEGKHEVSIRDLVRNSLRMRPDRIIVGETRGAEAFDMLQAMNTGHEGSVSTVHANSPRDGLARIENMVLMAGMELPLRVIREQIASALDLIIQVSRLQDGSRRVTAITEVAGQEGDTITLQDIFTFQIDHVDPDGRVHGQMEATGLRPGF
jgi:pilus assembly protein CpaF